MAVLLESRALGQGLSGSPKSDRAPDVPAWGLGAASALAAPLPDRRGPSPHPVQQGKQLLMSFGRQMGTTELSLHAQRAWQQAGMSRLPAAVLGAVLAGLLLCLWDLPQLTLAPSGSQVRTEDPAGQISYDPSWCENIRQHEWQRYSQTGMDGILLYIFFNIGFTNKYYVEFGTESGVQTNSRIFREFGWKGLLMDGGFENETINLHMEFIAPSNINELFEKYRVPEVFDLLSIDVDYDDYFVWKAISPRYRPRVLVIEYNAQIEYGNRWVTAPEDSARWMNSSYFGSSLLSLVDLGRSKGYTLVACDLLGVNAVFIRSDILAAQKASPLPPEDLYVRYLHHPPELNEARKWVVLDEAGNEVERMYFKLAF